jgi:hypothetical protein
VIACFTFTGRFVLRTSVLLIGMALDPKVKNLIIFMTQKVVIPLILFVVIIKAIGITDYWRLFGQITGAILLWRAGLSFYRRKILPPKNPLEMGKWAIVTGKPSFEILSIA